MTVARHRRVLVSFFVEGGGCGGGWLVGAWSWSYRIPWRGCGWPVRIGCRLYVENYTVDASIFVAKFLRAHGGCLGTRNRRRT